MEPYLALFEPDRKAGGYVITFPDFGYGATQGETGEEAMALARDLLMLTIGDFIRDQALTQGQAPPRLRDSVPWNCPLCRRPKSISTPHF